MSNKKSGCSGCFTFFMILIAICIFCVIFVNVSPDTVSDYDYGDGDYSDESDDSGISLDDIFSNKGDGADDGTGDGQTDNVTPVPEEKDEEPSGYLYYYNQLDSTEKEVYRKLLEAAKGGKDKVVFKDINYAAYGPAVKDAIYAFTYDQPVYFWITNGYRTEYLDRSGTYNDELTFYFDNYSYWNFTMSPEKYINELNAEVDKVAALAKQYSTPMEQAIFVHDYLTKNAEYDHDSLAEARKTIHAASCEYIYSAYGCLVNKKTVCSGYSEAFQLIMNKLGVNTTVVVGDANGAHEWNMIELDGEYYYIDVTWDDHDRKNDSGVFIYTDDSEYEYMCITSEELRKTHTPDSVMFSPPHCLSTQYNYFVYMGYYISDYSFDEVQRIVEAQKGERKIISVKFANNIEFSEAVAEIITNGKAFDIPALSNGYKYVTDDVHYTIKFFIE